MKLLATGTCQTLTVLRVVGSSQLRGGPPSSVDPCWQSVAELQTCPDSIAPDGAWAGFGLAVRASALRGARARGQPKARPWVLATLLPRPVNAVQDLKERFLADYV